MDRRLLAISRFCNQENVRSAKHVFVAGKRQLRHSRQCHAVCLFADVVNPAAPFLTLSLESIHLKSRLFKSPSRSTSGKLGGSRNQSCAVKAEVALS